jgi:hypothetical protein
MAKTTVELPDVLHRKLRVKAAIENRSMNDIMIAAVKDYLHNFRLDPGVFEIDTVAVNGETEPVGSKEV